MKEGSRDIPAFKEKLVPHGEHSGKTKEGKLYQLVGREDVVVRPLEWEKNLEKGYFRPQGYTFVTAQEYARVAKEHFEELRRYGVEAPVQFLVAESEKKVGGEQPREEVYAVVENIKKAPEPELSRMGKHYAQLRRNLLAYYTDKLKKNESYLADLWRDTQYVYGKKNGDELDSLYLVDIEPYIYHGPLPLRRIIRDTAEIVSRESKYFGNPPEYQGLVSGFEALLKQIEDAISRKK